MVEALLSAIRVLPLEVASARRAGEVRRELERAPTAIGMADSLIAGIALDHRAILITKSNRHYQRVPGLRLSSHYI